jgi:hypothetical protein
MNWFTEQFRQIVLWGVMVLTDSERRAGDPFQHQNEDVEDDAGP